jgi:hypothetical protein
MAPFAASGGAEPGPGIAERELLGCRRHSLAAEPAIGRLTGPHPAAGEAEIEQDRRRNDRHYHRAHGKAAARLSEPIHDPRGSIETKGRAAGQHDSVDAVDQSAGSEQFGLAAAGRPATDIDRSRGRRFGEHDRGAADSRMVLGLTNQNPRHIRDQIARAGSGRHGCLSCAATANPAYTIGPRPDLFSQDRADGA